MEYILCEVCANRLANVSTSDVFLGDMTKAHGLCEGCGETCGYEYTFVQVSPTQVEYLESI